MVGSKYYRNMLERYESMRDMDAWSDPVMATINCLDDSDDYARYLDNTPEAMRSRYDFRDGAAHMLAYVFGLDISAARSMLQTHKAWAEYDDSCKS